MTISRMTIGGVAALSLIAIVADPASAQERLVANDASTRTIAAFKVSETALQKFVPAGWELSPLGAGPSKGANLIGVFMQPIVAQGPDGKAQDLIRVAAFSFPAKRTGTEATVSMVFAGFASSASYVPGPYGAFELAKANVEQNVRTDAGGTSSVQESWEFQADNGSGIEFQVQYVRAFPVRGKAETTPHSAKMPDFYRIDRFDQAADVVRSAATDTDRVQKVAYKAVGQPLGQLLDGTEQLISITSIPLYTRQLFQPGGGTQ
jgi:hypothetical protein